MDNEKLYGVSSKYEGRSGWSYEVYGPFRSEKEADSWLHTQENDFRERSLVSKSAAIKLAGQRAFGLSKINLDYFVNEVLKKLGSS